MTTLNSKPGSSTAKQRSTLVIAGRRRGLELAEIRRMVGGSISRLSRAQASEWIKTLSGRDLPNPPGQAPGGYGGKRKDKGVARMRHPDVVEQIRRLMLWYFDGDEDHAADWLETNFGVRDPEDIDTADRAAKVSWVLKEMHERRADKESICHT